MSVLVMGASGAIGGAVLRGLLERGVEVRATSRTPERLSLPASVQTFAADAAEPASFADALRSVDRVFLYADLPEPEALLATVAAAGVQHVVLLSSAAATSPGAEDDFNGSRFLRAERATREAGVAHTLLRPCEFASNAARWSWSIKGESTVPLPYPDAVQTPIHDQDIADVAVIALTGDTLLDAAPILTGPERLTLRDQVATIGEVIERPLAVIEQTEAESAALLSAHLPDVWVQQILKGWRQSVGASPALSGEYSRITGRSPRTFRTWAADHAGLFR